MTSFQTMSARQTVLGVTAGCAPKTENKCQAPERAHPLASFFFKKIPIHSEDVQEPARQEPYLDLTPAQFKL